MKHKQLGFTLIELMIVVTIIGILVTIAIPSYRDYGVRATRSVGHAELLKAVSRQEQYFINNKSYTADLTALGYPASPYYINDQGQAQATATNSVYAITATSASSNEFTVTATPQNGQVDDDECGSLSINQYGEKTETGTNDSSDCF